MKTHKLYEIRVYGPNQTVRGLSCRQLRPYNRARKLTGYLRRRYGLDTCIAAWNIRVAA